MFQIMDLIFGHSEVREYCPTADVRNRYKNGQKKKSEETFFFESRLSQNPFLNKNFHFLETVNDGKMVSGHF
jgi:hypothetical protein